MAQRHGWQLFGIPQSLNQKSNHWAQYRPNTRKADLELCVRVYICMHASLYMSLHINSPHYPHIEIGETGRRKEGGRQDLPYWRICFMNPGVQVLGANMAVSVGFREHKVRAEILIIAVKMIMFMTASLTRVHLDLLTHRLSSCKH